MRLMALSAVTSKGDMNPPPVTKSSVPAECIEFELRIRTMQEQNHSISPLLSHPKQCPSVSCPFYIDDLSMVPAPPDISAPCAALQDTQLADIEIRSDVAYSNLICDTQVFLVGVRGIAFGFGELINDQTG